MKQNSLRTILPLNCTFAVFIAALIFAVSRISAAVIGTNSFAPKFDLPVQSIQVAVAVGDLDGDGRPDLVVGNVTSSSISIYRNISSNGVLNAGAFGPRVDITVGSFPYSVAVGDIDGDGRLDIISGINGNGTGTTVVVLRNLTSGPGPMTAASFATPVSFTVAIGPTRIAVGDLDGDGRKDLAVITSEGGGVSVLRNTGTPGLVNAGTFAPFFHILTGPNSWDVKIGDLDGDGKPDMVASSYNGGNISLLRNISTPGSLTNNSFAPKVDINIGTGIFNTAIGDLDLDGKPDLVVTKLTSDSIAVLRNVSTPGSLTVGSFTAPFTLLTGVGPRDVTVGDLDGDGKLEIAVADVNTAYISVFQNNSTPGTLTPASFRPRVDLLCGPTPAMNAIADLDGNGQPEIIATSFGGSSFSILKNLIPPALPPVITQQPASQTVLLGGSVEFQSDATGSPPLRYQWFFDGQSLAAETNKSLLLTNVQLAQAGPYWVTVSNGAGSVTSSIAILSIDRAPIADASATVTPVIAPLNCDGGTSFGTVILDGSRSSDPDGNALTYSWFKDGVSNAIATGVVAVVQFPVGTTHLTLVVSDGFASSSQPFIVEVITPDEVLARLMATARADADKAQPLIASLRAAIASINRCQPEVAINQLEALKNKILAQVAPNDPAFANQLLAEVQVVIDALNGGAAEAVPLEITSATQGNNGKPHLKIRGNAGRVHIIEVSTDMVSWVKVGVASCKGGRDYEFNDAGAALVGARFYRIVSPK